MSCERVGPLLDAYHDGELGRLRRLRVRRHLDRCDACRDELASLDGIGAWVRDALDGDGAHAPAPDLWSDIRWQIAARRGQGAPAAPRRRPLGGRFGLPALGAGVVAAGIATTFLLGPPQLLDSAARTVVRSLNTHGRPVMVFDGPDDATIIWLMDEQGSRVAEESTSVWI
jgi:anti-sigma factor RsiW